ncbi:hypothetical protein D5086_029415 [Populus alba]
MDTVTVEACFEDETIEDARLDEEQLDFSFSDDDCYNASPFPSPLATLVLPLDTSRGSSPPFSLKVASSLSSVFGSGVWWNLFSSLSSVFGSGV